MKQPTNAALTPVARAAAPWDAGNLLEIDFRHSDPESIENLLEQMPSTQEVPVIEFYYDTRSSGAGMVRCRHCKKTSANHNRGFVLRYADGTRVLFGKDCGAKHFGEIFVDQEKRFQAARKLQELLRRKAFVQANRLAAISVIEQIEGYAGWRTYCDTKRSFRNAFWYVVTDVGVVAQRHGGRLTRTERVRDHEAEARQDTKNKKRPKAIYRDVAVDMGVLAGLSFFEAGPLPDKALPDLFQRLKSALWSVDDKERAYDLELTLRGIEGLIEEIERLAGVVSGLSVAASSKNIDLLCRWLTANGHGNYRYVDGRLYRHDAADNVVSVSSSKDERTGKAVAQLVIPSPFPTGLFADLRSLLRPIA